MAMDMKRRPTLKVEFRVKVAADPEVAAASACPSAIDPESEWIGCPGSCAFRVPMDTSSSCREFPFFPIQSLQIVLLYEDNSKTSLHPGQDISLILWTHDPSNERWEWAVHQPQNWARKQTALAS